MKPGIFQIAGLALIAWISCDLAHAQEIEINCGGTAYTSAGAVNWQTDRYYTGGDLYYAGDSIANTTDLALFRSARVGLYGDFSYTVPVANGNYNLNLLFAELQYWNRGDRVFNVLVNGSPVLTNFDILTQVASRTALVKSFPITVTTGLVRIDVQGVVKRGILSAIQLLPSTSGGTTPPPPTATGTPLVSINAGGNAFTGIDGTPWTGDQYFTGGDLAYSGYTIAGASDLQLYRSARRGLYGNFGYSIPLPNGSYTLKLRFAEILLGGKGQRVFNVNVNGVPALTNFDIVADAGDALIADDKQFAVNVANGILQIDVVGVVGFGLVNGIQVFPAAATTPPASPALSLSSAALSFTGIAGGVSPTAQTVTVTNSGGGTLAWTAVSNQPWLTVSPASGSGPGTFSVAANLAGLAAGNYTAAVTVAAPGATGSPATVNVTLSVAAAVQPPAVSVSPSLMAFTATAGAANPSIQLLTVSNTGGGTLNWTATKTQPWLALSSASGTAGAILSIQANVAGLTAGPYTDTITISAPGANPASQSVAVTFTVAAAVQPPALSASPSAMTFSVTAGAANPAAQSIAITNTGGGTLNWTAAKTQSWLSLSSTSGTGAGNIGVQANVAGLAAGTYTDAISINAAGATPASQTISVTFTVAAAVQPPALSVSPSAMTFSATAGAATPAAQSIAITNTGGGTLNWTAAKTQSWLSLSSTSGAGAGNIGVQANIAGLAAGTYTDTISISAAGATPASQTIPVTFTVAPAQPATTQTPLVSINCGGAAYTGADGTPWTADQYYTGGDLAYTGYLVSGSPDLPVFRSARRGLYGDFSYTIPVPNGSYILKLRFAEIMLGGTGQRIFNVNVNGVPALTNFDIIADAGATLTLDDKQFPVTVANGNIQIDFIGVVGRGLVNAIQVFPAGSAVTPPAVPVLSVSPTAVSFSGTAGGVNPAPQSIAIANTGAGTLSWSAASSQNWLTILPAAGTGAGAFSLSPNLAGLAAGSYTAVVTVGAPGATSAPQTINVTLAVAAAVQSPALSTSPAAMAFSATAGGANAASQLLTISNTGGGTLTWTASNTQPWLALSSASGSNAGSIFVLTNIAGLVAGTYNDTITIAAPGATPSVKTVAVTLTVSAAAVPSITYFTATQTSIAAGQQTSLSWAISGATGASIDNGVGAVVTSSSVTVSPTATTTYTLTATNSGGSVTRTVTITVTPAPPSITFFTATQTSITAGQQSSLSWAISGATSASIDNGIGSVATSSSVTVSPTATTTYTLTATNAGGSVTKTVTVTVTAATPSIASFTATPASITAGQSATLVWSMTGATSASIDNGIGAVAANSSVAVTPTVTTTYKLTATSAAGSVSQTVTVTVTPATPSIASFTTSQTTVTAGQSATLSWSTSGATGASIDNGVGAVAINGSVAVTPAATTTYTLMASNSAGSVIRTIIITVTAAPPPPVTGSSNNTDQWTAVPNSPQVTNPNGGQILYNGIQLPAQWPPQTAPTQVSSVPSYILHPPAVIPIDTGRQLFVDDFLIGNTSLARVQHQPVMYPGNPVLAPATQGLDNLNNAFPFSDGVWFDPADHLFKMWYFGGNGNDICYAYSTDGKNWIKPRIADAAVPNSNMVLQIGGGRDSTTVVMDLHETNPARKFKAFVYYTPNSTPIIWIYFSPDGIHWTGPQSVTPLSLSDRTTVFFNPFRNVWVESARQKADLPATPNRAEYFARARFYSESADLQTWNSSNPANTYWTGPEERDPVYPGSTRPPDLYTLDGTAYESLMVGLFSWYYPSDGPELVELGIGFSRDGFNWVRPTRSNGPNGAFIPATNLPNTWNGYNTQSAGGGFLVVGDQLYFYFSGRNAQHNSENSSTLRQTGLATLRRDGFYSMDAGAAQGTLTTRPLRFSGSHLFVNVADAAGQLQVEVLDSNGSVIPQFSKANSSVISVDKTMQEVTWSGASIAALAGQNVQFRFYLTNGSLYAFWVTNSTAGASNGYVAAGGPGFTSNIDTVGSAAGGGTVAGAVAAPVISPAGGTFSGAVTVSITSATPGAIIRFTNDGTDPNANSALYTGPFVLNSSLTLKAKAFAPGMTDSATTLGLFTVQSDITPPSRGSGLPSGTLASSTTQATLSLRTSEPATCKYSTVPNTAFSAMTALFATSDGIVQTAPLNGLASATVYTYYVRCQDANGNANTDDYVITFAIAGSGAFVPFYQYIEAESGAVTAPMVVASDPLASGGSYIYTPTDSSGSVTFTVNVPTTGTYYVWGKILSVDAGSDSFFVSADGGVVDVFDTAENKWSSAWQWTAVNGRGSTGHPLALNPRTFTLSAGAHTFTFGGRDPNTKLDQIVVTNDAGFVPNR